MVELSLDFHRMMVDESQFTGLILQQQLFKSMIQLKSLHFYAHLASRLDNLEGLLSTFQTPFWVDRHWTVAMHGAHLYTIAISLRSDQIQ